MVLSKYVTLQSVMMDAWLYSKVGVVVGSTSIYNSVSTCMTKDLNPKFMQY